MTFYLVQETGLSDIPDIQVSAAYNRVSLALIDEGLIGSEVTEPTHITVVREDGIVLHRKTYRPIGLVGDPWINPE